LRAIHRAKRILPFHTFRGHSDVYASAYGAPPYTISDPDAYPNADAIPG
jgi:hypothetical protein